ncbi:MAG: hypothetical protein RIS64_127 [Bacteroidota bacterium]|jgi:hypothetical protein
MCNFLAKCCAPVEGKYRFTDGFVLVEIKITFLYKFATNLYNFYNRIQYLEMGIFDIMFYAHVVVLLYELILLSLRLK